MSSPVRSSFICQAALFLVCVLSPGIVFGQSASDVGLVLRGDTSNSAAQCEKRKDEECHHLRMVFENRGKQPVIIINPTLGFGSGLKEVIIYYREYGTEPRTYITVEGARKSVETPADKFENLKSMAPLFDADRPPQNVTIALGPGESFTFEESVVVKQDTRIPEKDFETVRFKHPISDSCDDRGCVRDPYGARLVYQFSFLRLFADPNFLEKISDKWKPYGILPVDVNGLYTVTSEMVRW